MLKSLSLNNFSLFSIADFEFSKGLNIFCGDNGTGKSSAIRLCYAVENCLFNAGAEAFGKISMQDYLFAKINSSLSWNFKAKEISHLANFNAPDYAKAQISIRHDDCERDVAFSFDNINSGSFAIDLSPTKTLNKRPIWIDPYFSLSNFPDPTCRDLSETDKKVIEEICEKIVMQIKSSVGSGVDIDQFGRCYLKETEEPLYFSCFSEPIIRILVILRMVKTGAVFGGNYLFLDCSDSDMDIKFKKCFAETICSLAQIGTQIFLSTQSDRMIESISEYRDQKNIDCKYFMHLRDSKGNIFVKYKNG